MNNNPSREYRMKPGSFGEMRKQILRGMLLPGLFILAMIGWFVWGGEASAWIIAGIIPVIIGFTMYNAIKRQEKQFYSYRLVVTEESVMREQEGVASISIPRQEITKIVKSNTGAISIIGRNRLNAIIVYAQVERAEELEQQLELLAPVTVKKNSWQQMMILPYLLLLLAVIYGTFAVDDMLLSGLCLLVFTASMIWSLIVIYTSRNVEKRMKNLGWIGLIPILAVISAWFSKWEVW